MTESTAKNGNGATGGAKPRRKPLTAEQKKKAAEDKAKKEADLIAIQEAEALKKKEEEAKEQEKQKVEEEKRKAEAEAAALAEAKHINNPETLTDDEFDQGKRDGNPNPDDSEGEGTGQVSLNDSGDLKIDKNPPQDPPLPPNEEAPFVRRTRIEKTTTTSSVKALYKEYKKDLQAIAQMKADEEIALAKGEEYIPPTDDGVTLRFDLAIQRNEAWTEIQKSDFIHSLIYGHYIPPVLVQDTSDGKKWFIDGKQRIYTTLLPFLDGEWALSKKTRDVYGYKIAGKKFMDLPVEMQDEINDEVLTIVRIKNMTTPERDDMFVKQNSGTPLSKIELIRAMHSELSEQIDLEVASLKFFKEDLELTKKAKDKFMDVEIILQTAMLLEEGRDGIKGFEMDHIKNYVLNLKEQNSVLSDEMLGMFNNVSEYLTLAFEDYEMDEVKKSLKKVNVPIIFWTARTAIAEQLQPKLFGDFIKMFLITKYSIDSKYGQSGQAGSPKKDKVLTRIDEMEKALLKFFEVLKTSPSMEDGFKKFENYLEKENKSAIEEKSANENKEDDNSDSEE